MNFKDKGKTSRKEGEMTNFRSEISDSRSMIQEEKKYSVKSDMPN